MKYVENILVTCLFLLPSLSSAEYITDELRAAVRAGPSYEYRILKYLPTGTQIKTSKANLSDEWIEVESDDVRGWTLKQYISPTKTAKMYLDVARKKIARLEKKITNFKEQIKELSLYQENSSAELQSLKVELQELNEQHERLLFASENAVEIQDNYNALQHRHEQLKLENDRMRTETASLRNSQLITGIQWGILAVCLGVFLTIFLPKIASQRRKSSW